MSRRPSSRMLFQQLLNSSDAEQQAAAMVEFARRTEVTSWTTGDDRRFSKAIADMGELRRQCANWMRDEVLKVILGWNEDPDPPKFTTSLLLDNRSLANELASRRVATRYSQIPLRDFYMTVASVVSECCEETIAMRNDTTVSDEKAKTLEISPVGTIAHAITQPKRAQQFRLEWERFQDTTGDVFKLAYLTGRNESEIASLLDLESRAVSASLSFLQPQLH